MTISFENALGIHPHSLRIRSQRAEMLATNLAQANTPGYKAQDLSFEQALSQANRPIQQATRTHPQHQSFAFTNALSSPLYRIPNQPDVGDGNTVDTQLERSLFMQNALEYQASLDFLSGKFTQLTKAIKGG